jgi:hypothetical protein
LKPDDIADFVAVSSGIKNDDIRIFIEAALQQIPQI